MKTFIALAIISLTLMSCGSVPVTGRKQLLLVSDSEVMTSSLSQYSEYIKSVPLSTDKKKTEMVKRVGKKIAAATENYLKQNGLESEIANLQWEFNLVKDSQANAFCMPGGKIVVYEGILPYMSSDDELAVVLGHEVAHAIAKHSNERMSQQLLTQYGASILSESLGTKSAAIQTLGNTVYGVGSQYGVTLPFSRKHEYEADHLGLIFMTMAGYNPNAAITFWEKMAADGGGVPEFMSTHPNETNRINEIKKMLPEMEQYKPKK